MSRLPLLLLAVASAVAVRQGPALPDRPLVYGFFTARFGGDGAFTMGGDG